MLVSVTPLSSAQAGPGCGSGATIVGTPGGVVIGTDGDDVIVTNGAQSVESGAGNDGVCVTGAQPPEAVMIDTGSGDDTVSTQRDDHPGDRIVSIRLGSGDDYLLVGPDVQGSLAGGRGRDSLAVLRTPRVTSSSPNGTGKLQVNTVEGWLQFAHRPRVDIASFLDLRLSGFATNLVRLGAGSEYLTMNGCWATVHAGAGSDHVRLTRRPGCDPPDERVVLRAYGGPGDDRLFSYDGRSVLIGGPGHDTAHGGLGFDRCVAEIRTYCESR